MADTKIIAPQFYDAAPITEAVVEIRFTDRKPLKELKKLSKKIAAFYPSEIEQTARGVQIDFLSAEATFKDEGNLIRRTTLDEVEIAIIKNEAYSFSRLAPYPGWDHFEAQIERDLSILQKAGGRRTVAQIGMRYINRIDIPMIDGIVKHEEYLNVYVTIPPLVESVGHYSLQFQTRVSNPDCRVNVNSGTVEPLVPDTYAFLLDIDVIAGTDLPQATPEVMDLLRQMRAKKNELFEAFITPKARALFHA